MPVSEPADQRLSIPLVTGAGFLMQRWMAGAMLTLVLSGEIIDRVAASIGRQVITEADVTDEIRVQSFIDEKAPDFSVENKRKALDRLVDQTLIRRELE